MSGFGSSPPRGPPSDGGSQPPTPSRTWPFNSSFESPLRSFQAQRHPNREHYIVIDRSQGYIRTTVDDARQYAELGYEVGDLAGHRVTDWDPPLELAGLSREFIDFAAFNKQKVDVYDAEDQIQAERDAHWDDTLFYNKDTKKWQRRKATEDVKSPKGKGLGGNDKQDPPTGGSGAGQVAA